MGHLESDCENVFRDLKYWTKISNLRELVEMRHSREEFCWDERQNYS